MTKHTCNICGESFGSNRALGVHKGRGHPSPWQDKSTLIKLYIEEDKSTRQIANELGCEASTVSRWLDEHNINKQKRYEDPVLLERLYRQERLSEKEIANRFSCSASTIHRKLVKYDIDRRPPAHDASDSYGDFCYSYIWHRKNGDWDRIRVHRLVAYAHGMIDFDELFDADIHIHHKNGLPWVNSIENLERMGEIEHFKHHFGRG